MNPRGYAFPVVLRTWTQGRTTALLSSGAAAAVPFFNGDFPNPRGAIQSIELRRWVDNLRVAPGDLPPTNYDFPNPRGAVPAIGLRTFVDPLKLYRLAKDQCFGSAGQPPANLDWPNPRGPVPATSLRTWIDQVRLVLQPVAAAPPTNYDFPNPRGAVPAIGLRTFVDPLKINLLGKDQFFGAAGQPPANLDWPNPRGYVPAVALRSWMHNHVLPLEVAASVSCVATPRGAVGTATPRPPC